MRHLDEGTIHAWLDGALSAGESSSIEAHVAECGACAEMVAEARGLIAGASRILTGLDHVPRGVIPGGAPAAPVRPVRRWASRPALRAAAAVLFVVGASVVVVRQTTLEDIAVPRASDAPAPVAESAPPVVPPAVVSGPARQEAATAPAGAGAAAAADAQANRPEASQAPAAKVQLDEVVVSRQDTALRRAAAEASTSRTLRDSVGVLGKVTGQQARSVPPPAAAPPPAPTVGQDASQRAAGAVQGAIGAAGQQVSGVSADSLRAVEARQSDSSRVRSVAEAARRRDLNLQGITVTGTSTAVRDSVAERMRQSAPLRLQEIVTSSVQPQPFGNPGVEMAGCYAITVGPWSGARGLITPAPIPALLRLDPTMLGIERDGPRLILRAPADTTAIRPDSSFWRISARDSLLIVWRATTPEITLRLQIRDPLLAGVAQFGDRTAPVTARRVSAACDEQRDH